MIDKQTDTQPTAAPDGDEGRVRQVLILDDDLGVLGMLREYLRAPHLHLVTCSEIEAALALMEHLPFDVLITDLEVSALGGLEGVRLIRHVVANYPDTTVVAFSGKLDGDGSRLAASTGATAVLRKPTGLWRLRELVDEGVPRARRSATDRDAGEISITGSIAETLRNGSISAVLQPIITLGRNGMQSVLGTEGLARGPQGSPLRNPEILLSYASRKNRLLEVELRCIGAVLEEARVLPKGCTLFINLRPRSLSMPDCVSSIGDLVRAAGQQATDVVIELSEQQSILNPDAFAAALSTARAHGFRVALDDYGQGFANLRLLEELQPDYLKIDGVFCQELEASSCKQAVVRSTIEMAHALGISTIMERVETKAELDMVRELGVDHAQGYFFSRPVPGLELTKWLGGSSCEHPEAGEATRAANLRTAC